MHIAFDGGHDDAALRLGVDRFLGFHERHQIRHRFLHHPRALDHLRQKHFARSKKIADHAHAGHKRAFDHIERALAFLPRFLGVDIDVIDDAFHHSVFQTLLHRLSAPCFIFDGRFVFRLHSLCEID